MIRRGFIREVNRKIDIILENCKELNLEFDNQRPNAYAIITKNKIFTFSTYKDVIHALDLLKEMK